MPNKLSENEVAEFYSSYKELGEEDLYLVLANSLRYSDETKEPILGFGDNVEAIILYLKDQARIVKENMCEILCNEPDAKDVFENAHKDTKFFAAFVTLLDKFTAGTELESIAASLDSSAILAMLLIFKRGKQAVDVYCGCI